MVAVLIMNQAYKIWSALNNSSQIGYHGNKETSTLIYEIQNFANTYLGKVSKFQGNGLFSFGVLSHSLDWR